jgi:predicted RNA-binding protein with RPS1 domain
MSLTKRVTRPDEIVKEGETVKVRIKEVRADEQKLLLSIKDADEDAEYLATAVRAAPSGARGATAAGSGFGGGMGTLGDQFKGLFESGTNAGQPKKKS